MNDKLKQAADTVLANTVGCAGGAPGVVAMVTDRKTNVYEGAAGRRSLGGDAPMTTDSVMAIFSTSKAITGTTLMQLVEEGQVRLDDPVRKYVPEIAEIQVLEGFDAAGQPKLRAPKRDITINHLMLHTAGFSYEFFSADDLKLRGAKGIPSVVSSTFASVKTCLLWDPGEKWGYGVNIDWVGKVVEAVRGKRLGDVMQERVFAPLGMNDTSFVMTPSMQSRRAVIHDRAMDGKLTPLPDLVLPQPPEMDMGGHGLYSTVGDYMKFIRMILNDGAGPNGRVLKTETVDQMSRNGLGALKSGGWTTSIPSLSNTGEFFPGLPKSWGYTFMINDEATPSGRPAGSLMWAGLANLFYWIDRESGIGGFWGSQILPFQDVSSYPGFVDFETAVYRHLKR
ncbi:MAG TPA: serine hydrolase domain-containing protein [Burkholderiaceae bacterium]|mgnify:FL=1|jgi:methyl acetate hydrolase|nr:serine hydrolase domain-containing protein [Burkholderiaceae bacterium]